MRRILIPLVAAAMLFCTLPALAQDGEQSVTVDRTMDFFVVVNEPQLFSARTQLCDEPSVLWCAHPDQGGHFIDSALWLYAADGAMITASDDDGVSYASLIRIQLEPGTYRLRAGRFGPCDARGCMNPEAPFTVGAYYTLLTSLPLILDPEPPTASPEPIPSELPSMSPSPLPSVEPSPEVPSVQPSPSATPEPTVEPSPSVEPSPTATPEPSPSPSPSADPSPTPSVAPTATPTPTPTPTPESPSPSPSVAQTPLPEPSAEPSPEPSSEPLVIDPGAAVAALSEALGDAAAAVGEAAAFVAKLGHEYTPAEKKQAAATIIPAVIITQLAQAAVAAASAAAASAASSGGSRKGTK